MSEMTVRPRTVEVRSERKAGVSYEVTLAHCTCPDFFWRHRHGDRDPFCKHIKAAYATMAGWRSPAA